MRYSESARTCGNWAFENGGTVSHLSQFYRVSRRRPSSESSRVSAEVWAPRSFLVIISLERKTSVTSLLLARLMDRFPLQVHLEPSDISEVTSKRVLAKTADSEKTLAAL